MVGREPHHGLSPRESARRPSGGMADAGDLKSPARKGVWVQIPSGPVKNEGSEQADPNLVFHSHSEGEISPDLQKVIDRWHELTPEQRAEIMRVVQG